MTADGERTRTERLDASLAALEAAVARTVASETTRVDLADALAVMEDDRQRLASELDSALARSQALERANGAAEQRLQDVAGRIDRLLGEEAGV